MGMVVLPLPLAHKPFVRLCGFCGCQAGASAPTLTAHVRLVHLAHLFSAVHLKRPKSDVGNLNCPAALHHAPAAGEAAADGNEAFRVDAGPHSAASAGGGGSVAAAHAYDAAAQEQYAQWQAYYAQQQGHEYNPQQQAAAAAAAAGTADPAEAMLAAALAAEREKAARRGQRDAVGGIQIKEVSQGWGRGGGRGQERSPQQVAAGVHGERRGYLEAIGGAVQGAHALWLCQFAALAP